MKRPSQEARAEVRGDTIAQMAAVWWARQDRAALSPRERHAFESWIAASESHRDAYERVRRTWDSIGEAAGTSELQALRTAALNVAPPPRRWPQIAATAIGLGVVIGLAIGLPRLVRHSSPASTTLTALAKDETHATAGNERSTITLADGSVVTLNRDTTLEVEFTPSERRVRVARGQAFFEVAKNPGRPFVVAVADRTVTALGTQFDVRLDPGRLEVVLVEGKVAIDRADPTLLERLVLRKPRLELRPGQKLVASLGEASSITDVDARRSTSWRQGWITFENESVGRVVAELNRYSDRQIAVSDASLESLRLSGVFRVGQPDRFAATVQELLPVRAVPSGDGGILLVRAGAEGRADQP